VRPRSPSYVYGISALIQPVDEFVFTLLVRVVAFGLVVFLVGMVRERVLALEHSTEDLEAIRSALAPAALPEAAGLDVAAAFVPSMQRSLSLSTVELGLGREGGVLAYTDGATDLRLGGSLLGLEGLTRALAPFAHLPADRFAADAKAASSTWATSRSPTTSACWCCARPSRSTARRCRPRLSSDRSRARPRRPPPA
jgi:hypothetical protein